jgi:IMP dehydrogenase|tara:strand:+ start:660 stop:1715 length:1056 start_codon:yes stop_codon:yes gene_type:complete
MINKSQCLSYDDVLLVPQYSDIRSREEIDISSDLGKGISLRLPVLSSPMDTVTAAAMANCMNELGGAGVIHRYCTVEEQAELILSVRTRRLELMNDSTIGAAIGVTGDFMERAAAVHAAGADFFCIDVAHGHHILVREAIAAIRGAFGDSKHIMAGNVATLEGVNDLADWGADSARCNIGGGSICSTRIQTGHGLPGLDTIFRCAQTDRDIQIIADGGIKNSGDIVKALAAGADAVMIGSLLSGTSESPGEFYRETDGSHWKSYRGMASKEAQIDWRGKYSSLEGVAARVPHKGSATKVLKELERGIRSGFSYSGARNLQELWAKSEFVQQTNAGQTESKTHILTTAAKAI